MAISVDWATKIISVPKADTTLIQSVPTEIRELNIDSFRIEMDQLSDDLTEGMWQVYWVNHVAPITVGGVTLARVVEVINGFTVTFEDGQYAVNLVGANSNIGDVTNVNQVSVRSANSAGLTYSKQIEDTAYLDQRIWVDTNNGTAGQVYPLGTPALPCLTFADAIAIQQGRGLPARFRGVGSATISSPADLDNFDLLGASHILSNFTVNSGVSTQSTIFEKLSLSGTLDGDVILKTCEVGTLAGFSGELRSCGIGGVITLATGVSADIHELVGCHSQVSGTGTPGINCNSLNNLEVSIRDYTGGIEITNYSGAANTMSIDLLSGHAKIAATCTAGTIVVRGTGHITDNSGAGCTVVTTGLVRGESVERSMKAVAYRQFTNDATGNLDIYDDADVLDQSVPIYEDNGTTSWDGTGPIVRRDKIV